MHMRDNNLKKGTWSGDTVSCDKVIIYCRVKLLTVKIVKSTSATDPAHLYIYKHKYTQISHKSLAQRRYRDI